MEKFSRAGPLSIEVVRTGGGEHPADLSTAFLAVCADLRPHEAQSAEKDLAFFARQIVKLL